jgi:hypothetical protein
MLEGIALVLIVLTVAPFRAAQHQCKKIKWKLGGREGPPPQKTNFMQ